MKRKSYSKEFEENIVKEVSETGNSTLVATKHDLLPATVSGGVRESKNNKNSAIVVKNSNNKVVEKLEKENVKLKELLGEKDLEIAILRDLVKKNLL